ncbi:MAG: hypothetical protein IPH62_10400 [Ignavibacteriae bacterium]|nr:hypothetical protein [Ignavibacteriota bacterium]
MNHNEIKKSVNNLFDNVDNFISDLKLKSSEEILNGSIVEAQKLISKILPYQNFYEKLKDARQAFYEIEINHESKKEIKKVIKNEIAEPENNEEFDDDIFENDVEEEENEKITVTAQNNFRIPILKSLIFLGGSSEESEVIDFVKRDMRNKLTSADFEISNEDDKERWLTNLYFETATMIDEGLLTHESSNKKWEIAQKGVDYLGKYAK